MSRLAVAVLVVLVRAGAAWASGLSAPEIGTSRSSPVHADPSAVHWNPALLADLGLEVLPAGSLILLGARYERDRRGIYQHPDGLTYDTPLPDEALQPGKAGRAAAVSALQVIPGAAIYAALPVRPDLVLGLGLFHPFAAMLSYAEEGPQRWALQDVALVVSELAGGVGWRATPTLRLGAGLSVVGGVLQLRKQADLAGTNLLAGTFSERPMSQPYRLGPNAPPEVRELDALSRPVTVGPAYTISWAARLGAAFEPDADWLVGVSYVHRPAPVFSGSFELDLDDPLFTHDLVPQGLKYPPTARGRAEVDLPLPPSLHAGLRWQARPGLTLSATLAWFRWSVVESLDVRLESNHLVQPELGLGSVAELRIPREWADTLHGDVRALVRLNDLWEVGGLLGYHSPASPDVTLDVASPDGHRVVVAALAGFSPAGAVEWLGSLQVQWVPERETAASAYDLANGRYALVLVTGTVAARIRF